MKPKIPRGWRRLKLGELIRTGDKGLSYVDCDWVTTMWVSRDKVMIGTHSAPYIRRKSARSPSKRKGES